MCYQTPRLQSCLLNRQNARQGFFPARFRRAVRNAFLWPEEVSDLVAQNRTLTELRSIGSFIETQIWRWIDKPPSHAKTVPAIRREFISLAEARRLLATYPASSTKLRGDLQMHTHWGDESATIAEMADAAANRLSDYIAITDHSKALKIAAESTNAR
jgi:hypothetical protein